MQDRLVLDSSTPDNPLGVVFARLNMDLSSIGRDGCFSMFSLRDQEYVYGSAEGVGDLVGFGHSGFVLGAFGSLKLIDDDTDSERLLVEVASEVQDLIIDETGCGWPELSAEQGILSPALMGVNAVWVSRAEATVRIGELTNLKSSG